LILLISWLVPCFASPHLPTAITSPNSPAPTTRMERITLLFVAQSVFHCWKRTKKENKNLDPRRETSRRHCLKSWEKAPRSSLLPLQGHRCHRLSQILLGNTVRGLFFWEPGFEPWLVASQLEDFPPCYKHVLVERHNSFIMFFLDITCSFFWDIICSFGAAPNYSCCHYQFKILLNYAGHQNQCRAYWICAQRPSER
jgi:hypothetical protein